MQEQQPEVRIESAREIVDKVSISLAYAYQRLHQGWIQLHLEHGASLLDYPYKR